MEGVRFFPSRRELRAWFRAHHASAHELWVGYYKSHTGRTGVTYPEAVEEALCFGWIDTTIRRIDADRYAHRFTPRRPESAWSRTNRELFRALERRGLVTTAGLAAFQRSSRSPRTYSYESRPRALSPRLLQKLRSHPTAWSYFSNRSPGYRRLAAFWVMSAKRPETRERRLQMLIEASVEGREPRAFRVEREPTTDRKSAQPARRTLAPGSA